jgi:pimeloyl-ACP methyl ester carboxylesterase
MAHRLMAQRFAVFTVDYPSTTATLAELREVVAEQVHAAVGDARCDLVGHSLGGIVALQLKSGPLSGQVRRVVQMGSPNLGTPLADVIRRIPGVLEVMGPTLDALAESDIDLLTLPEDQRELLGAIAGTGGWRTVTQFYGLEDENDGKVSVESALGAEPGNSVIIETSHSLLTVSTTVADQVIAFLRAGQFEDPEALS